MCEVDQINFFNEYGYLIIENMFSIQEVELLKSQISELQNQLGVVTEENSKSIRSLNGVHKYNHHLSSVCKHPHIIRLVKKILSSDVYVHQFKINMKLGFDGDVWEWHQDHVFWLKEDGMMKPDALTAAIFLTEANEFNAPLMLIPRSHQLGTIDVLPQEGESNWASTVSAKLKYTAPQELIKEQVSKNGIVSAKAKVGSVLLFHCNILHASTKNLSPFDRVTMMISYNSINNRLVEVKNPRPDFLVEKIPSVINI